MSAPPKPWEGVGTNARSSSVAFDSPSRPPIGASGPRPSALRSSFNPSKMDSSTSNGTSVAKVPPLPPRPQTRRSTSSMMYGGSRYGNFFVCFVLFFYFSHGKLLQVVLFGEVPFVAFF